MTEKNIMKLMIVEKRKLNRTRKRAMLRQLAFWSTTHSVQTTASIARPSLISLPCRRFVKYYRHNSIMTHCPGLLPGCLWLAKQQHCYCAGAITSCFYPRTQAGAGISCRRVCLSVGLLARLQTWRAIVLSRVCLCACVSLTGTSTLQR